MFLSPIGVRGNSSKLAPLSPPGSANHKEMYDELEELGSQLFSYLDHLCIVFLFRAYNMNHVVMFAGPHSDVRILPQYTTYFLHLFSQCQGFWVWP